MAKKEVFVVKDSMTSGGDFIGRGTKVSLDDKEDSKLFDLGNVEAYDEKKHDAQADPLLQAQNEVQSLKDKVSELEKELATAKKGK